jgi:uncharacterized protein (DUF1330 family)
MSVYFVVQEQVNDPAGLQNYMKAARASSLGRGRAIIVDDDVTPVEGDWHGSRLVVLEFDDDAAFREWYDSPEYQAALPLRLSATDSRGALAKGLDSWALVWCIQCGFELKVECLHGRDQQHADVEHW